MLLRRPLQTRLSVGLVARWSNIASLFFNRRWFVCSSKPVLHTSWPPLLTPAVFK